MTPYYEMVLQLLWKAYDFSLQVFGRIPNKFLIPYQKEEITRLQRVQDGWTLFITTTGAIFDNHYPDSRLISFFKNHPIIFPRIIKTSPLKGVRSVFTDGSSQGLCSGSL